MQLYLVGGAVRDTLLGLPVQDRDWVVVGATPGELVQLGFVPVGKDFPVFLHPRSKEQYALARTERKTAPGYRGFVIHADPGVTLEQDLARRDLTINAIAVAAEYVQPDGSFDPARALLSDPFHGRSDLQNKVLRHVSDAFREDPVRVLRVARFAARFADFELATDTAQLMRTMVAQGEVAALVAERVWQELARGLMEASPARMFDLLHACGALGILLPEWKSAKSKSDSNSFRKSGSDSNSFHPSIASGIRALAFAARLQAPLPVRFACLCLHLQGVKAIARLCQRLRVPADCRELAEVAAREHAHVHSCASLDAEGLVRLLERCDAFRRPGRFSALLLVCECDARAQTAQQDAPYPQRQRLLAALAVAQAVETQSVATPALADGLSGKQVGDKVHAERVAAVLSAGPLPRKKRPPRGAAQYLRDRPWPIPGQ